MTLPSTINPLRWGCFLFVLNR